MAMETIFGMVELISLYDQRVWLPASKLVRRESAYGIYIDEGEVLLVTNKLNGKKGLPGGEIEKGESHETTLQREAEEEIGTSNIEVVQFVANAENFFYFNPPGQKAEAFHAVFAFYLCKVNRADIRDVGDAYEGNPKWYRIEDLKTEDFGQLISGSFLEIIKKAQQ
jgi:ADP-ribose pyrophosphatase YjhB (NUDIX family)